MQDQNFSIGYEYTVRFYPRWFTWVQSTLTSENNKHSDGTNGVINRLAGPLGMGPEYKIVVAINDDTVYAQAFIDLSSEPMVLTLPEYSNSYSILQLDLFGNVFSTSLSSSPPHSGGSYALVGPGYSGTLPDGVLGVDMPYNSSVLILRIDKYSSTGVDQIEAANEFRANMLLQKLSEYDPTCKEIKCGRTFIAPLFNYAPSVKLMADEGIAAAPEAFLATLQEAMASPSTEPLTSEDKELINEFNSRFDAARNSPDTKLLTSIICGAQAAHAAIINRWQSHRGSTNWIHFDNVGHWGDNYLDRAALTEYIQYGNDRTAAYYANAFVDDSGVPLNGNNFNYTIQFTKEQLPQAKRFWSVTAYTPGDIELVPNSINKYVVASYTPGLVTAEDGSVTIYLQADKPTEEKLANWLPIPKGSFSLLLRIYGPEGNALDGTYLPPNIHRTFLS